MNDWIPFVITAQPYARRSLKAFAILFVYAQFLVLIALVTLVVKLVWSA